MQRYSLYIDHMLVSQLIRQLQSIVKTCHQELDQQYESYELRTSIYQEFVFQITALFNCKYGVKQQTKELKDEELKKFYELTAKLQGISSDAKLEGLELPSPQIRKGRPSKNQQAEDNLIQWIRQKIISEGKLKFFKKELDEIYFPFFADGKKKLFPVNSYLRLFKKYNLREISILTRGGVQKTISDLNQKKNLNLSQQFRKKQEDDYAVKSQFIQQEDLYSTSEFSSQFQSDFQYTKDGGLVTKSTRFDDNQIDEMRQNLRSSSKKNTKKEIKSQKIKNKRKTLGNFFDDNSDVDDIIHEWHDLSMQNEFFGLGGQMNKDDDIYENSKSFQ